MFDKLLIIGCGLIGSSLLRATINKNYQKKYWFTKNPKNTKNK